MADQTPCETCDDTGWVCECHEDRPWEGVSSRHDACNGGPGVPCVCNETGSIERCCAEVICDLSGDKRH